jgi:hypothetical protein
MESKIIESKVICAFAGLGKTTFAKQHPDICIDMESSWWSKIPVQKYSEFEDNGEQEFINNPNFPENYVKAIQENVGKYEYILISSSIYVQELLRKNNIFYYLIYPTPDKKEEYVKRYIGRQSSMKFIDCITRNWDERLNHHKNTKDGCINIETNFNFLCDVMQWIIGSEKILIYE